MQMSTLIGHHATPTLGYVWRSYKEGGGREDEGEVGNLFHYYTQGMSSSFALCAALHPKMADRAELAIEQESPRRRSKSIASRGIIRCAEWISRWMWARV